LHLEKLLNATQISFAEHAILEDDNQLLIKQNDKAKHRRLTKSTVLGKAKMMSYENLKEARAKHAAKEEAATSKEKRSWKRKSPSAQSTVTRKTKRREGASWRSLGMKLQPLG